MWTTMKINTFLSYEDAHFKLCQKKLTAVGGLMAWMNAYEFALFTTPTTCYELKNTLHNHGLLLHEVASGHVLYNAPENHVHIMRLIEWNKAIVRAMIKRDDAKCVLLHGHPNGYEYSLKNGIHEVFDILQRSHYDIADVISYKTFSTTPSNVLQKLWCTNS